MIINILIIGGLQSSDPVGVRKSNGGQEVKNTIEHYCHPGLYFFKF